VKNRTASDTALLSIRSPVSIPQWNSVLSSCHRHFLIFFFILLKTQRPVLARGGHGPSLRPLRSSHPWKSQSSLPDIITRLSVETPSRFGPCKRLLGNNVTTMPGVVEVTADALSLILAGFLELGMPWQGKLPRNLRIRTRVHPLCCVNAAPWSRCFKQCHIFFISRPVANPKPLSVKIIPRFDLIKLKTLFQITMLRIFSGFAQNASNFDSFGSLTDRESKGFQ